MACPYFLLSRHDFDDCDVILSGELGGIPCNMSEFLFCHISSKAAHQMLFIYKVPAKYIATSDLHRCKVIAGNYAASDFEIFCLILHSLVYVF